MKNRGALIVIEGIDRTGKSTQCKKLTEQLKENNVPAELICFPDRTTNIGKLINGYLTKTVDLPDQVIHLLFTANRWELEPTIKKHLENGITIILDRYAFSGVAYSAAKKKENMDLEWCKNSDIGLPKPDCVLYLTLDQKVINERKGFGEEIYENTQFLNNVSDCYSKLKDHTWKVIDANKSKGDLTNELYSIILSVIGEVKGKPIETLW